MRKIYPKNRELFQELIPFAKEILLICEKNGIPTVIYGSFSHFYHTRDEEMKVNDVSAGTGFPALEFVGRGYRVNCMDAMDDEIKVFNRKAREKRLKVGCKKLTWLEIPKYYKKGGYDFVFYFDGGTVKHYVNDTLGVNNFKVYYLNLSGSSGDLSSIGVVPVFEGGLQGGVVSEIEIDDVSRKDIVEGVFEKVNDGFVEGGFGGGGGW